MPKHNALDANFILSFSFSIAISTLVGGCTTYGAMTRQRFEFILDIDDPLCRLLNDFLGNKAQGRWLRYLIQRGLESTSAPNGLRLRLIDKIIAYVTLLSKKGVLLQCSEMFAIRLGYLSNEIAGLHPWQLMTEKSAELSQMAIELKPMLRDN